MEYGTLTLCATPIGNLEDITYRAIRLMTEADFIAAEDTRHTKKLLTHFDIHTKLISYHEHNKIQKGPELIQLLKEGKNIVLVTDAGTPGISDPGEDLVKLALKEGIVVTSAPGAVAGITALIISGQDTRRFIFEGFLPINNREKQEVLDRLKNEVRTVILYEAPHRLIKTLQSLKDALGNRKITITKELTKKHENIQQTTLQEALVYYQNETPRGEYVLVLAGKDEEELKQEIKESFLSLSIDEHMKRYLSEGIDEKSAMKLVAKERGVSKREIYAFIHK